ncbi:rhomboid family intramembrane serine protease [Corynebacterium riegelii]|uniref:rhomboid family intramembrane serine protease n=1 Tax=Corynebacterium riegelii TaxID=156976 RepID=UPI0026D7C111
MNHNQHHTPPGWGYGPTGQPGYGKPFQRPFSHPETQMPAFYQGQPGLPGQPGQPGLPGPQFGQPKSKRKAQRRTGLRFAALYVLSIWVVFIINSIVFGGNLLYMGIHPLDVPSLPFIFTSPLLHGSLDHILGNTVPGAIFAYLVGYSGKRVFWEVTAFVVIIGGLGTWLFGGIGTNHVGASGLVYGWLAYLIVRGFFNRSGQQIALGVTLGFLYSGLVWGMFPGNPGVSWQAHLFGAIGGAVAAMIITSDDPPALVMKRQRKQLEKQQLKNAQQPVQMPYQQNPFGNQRR